MSKLKRFGYGKIGLIIGFASAVADYQAVTLLGVSISVANEISESHVAWFPLRAVAAIIAARFNASWVPGLGQKLSPPERGEQI